MTRSTRDKWLGHAGRLLVALILMYVLLPTVVVVISSFSSTSVLFFPPKGWSLRWFERALEYDDFRNGLYAGLVVTAWASTLATVIGTTLAIVIHRYDLRCKQAIEAVLLSPLFIPHFTMGLGLLMLVAQFNLGRGYALWFSAISCWCCPSCCAASMCRYRTCTSVSNGRQPALALRRCGCCGPSRSR